MARFAAGSYLCTHGLFCACRAFLRRPQPRRLLLVERATSFEEVAKQLELVGAVASQPGTGGLEGAAASDSRRQDQRLTTSNFG